MDCRILFIGDVVGKPGRQAIERLLPKVRQEFSVDCVIANGENTAGGKGIEPTTMAQLRAAGVDVVTSGNHIWDKSDVMQCFAEDMPLLRPANYPNTEEFPLPGKEFWVWKSPKGFSIAIINLIGRVFMDSVDCPFQCIAQHLPELRTITPIIFVDMHAEATSEKAAMGWYLDGKVSAVVGSHSHVPTADARLLPGKTAFQTDAGMTGPYDSIIGMEVDAIVEKFLSKRPKRFEVASGNIWLSSVLVTVDTQTGHAKEIIPVRRQL